MARKVVSISLPEELAERLEGAAVESSSSKSEVVRDALQRTLDLREWQELQRRFSRAAEARGIGSEDVERLIDEVRAEHHIQ